MTYSITWRAAVVQAVLPTRDSSQSWIDREAYSPAITARGAASGSLPIHTLSAVRQGGLPRYERSRSVSVVGLCRRPLLPCRLRPAEPCVSRFCQSSTSLSWQNARRTYYDHNVCRGSERTSFADRLTVVHITVSLVPAYAATVLKGALWVSASRDRSRCVRASGTGWPANVRASLPDRIETMARQFTPLKTWTLRGRLAQGRMGVARAREVEVGA